MTMIDGLEWDDCVEMLARRATRVVAQTGDVIPAFVAFAGGEPLLLADIRPFAKGAYADPVVELAALALPLGADRMAVAFGARAWSLDDPVVPVAQGIDLRQRVVAVHGADGTARPARPIDVLWPFSVTDGAVEWGAPISDGGSDGWLPSALRVLVDGRATMTATPSEVKAQARRCERLGHRLELASAAHERMRTDAVTCSSADPVASSPLPSRAAVRGARRGRHR